MSLRNRFYALAEKLIDSTFSDFAAITTITTTGQFDYTTQTAPTTTQTFNTIRLEYDEKQFDGQMIKVGDFKLIGRRQALTSVPTPDNTTVTRDGRVCNLISSKVDPGDASIIMHVRPQ